MVDPLDLGTLDDALRRAGVDPLVASAVAVERGPHARTEELGLVEALPQQATHGLPRDGVEEACRSAPVVWLVDHLLGRAVTIRERHPHRERAGDAGALSRMVCSRKC
jgi:hypothetical protein